jgi:hypothetical protein
LSSENGSGALLSRPYISLAATGGSVRMIRRERFMATGPDDSWFKWMVGTAIAFLAAGGGIVALLTYFTPTRVPPPPPQYGKGGTVSYVPKGQIERFDFEFHGTPEPGKREWQRADANNWFEYYPSGNRSTYRVAGRIQVDGCIGDRLIHPADNFEVFLPDRGCDHMSVKFRDRAGQWVFLGEMMNIN